MSLSSCNKLFVFKIRGRDEPKDRIAEKVRISTVVEPKAHFVAVGLEMLRADFMPRSENAALQEREGRFNGVGVNVAANVDAELVHDSLVPVTVPRSTGGTAILPEIIRHKNLAIVRDVLSDVLFEGSRAHVVRMKETQFALPLTNPDYDLFVSRSASALTMRATADISFVHLNNSTEFRLVNFSHCSANPMAEIPRSFVGGPNGALNLASGNAFLGFAEDCNRNEPLPQRQVRVMEDRARRDAELVMA